MWKANISPDVMQARLLMYQRIRVFFAARGVAEVDTPQLSSSGTTDVHIDSLTSEWQKQKLYWQTSPEFYMKRLIASGYPDCFQICKVFRNEPVSRHHSPEFTMLEWYRKDFSAEHLMAEIIDLLKTLQPRWQNVAIANRTYQSLFIPFGINVLRDSIVVIREQVIKALGYDPKLGDDRDAWLDCLFVTKIEPTFAELPMLFITDFPMSMASLAKTGINEHGDLVAKRFELYIDGIELCNGYEELTDADEQADRFDQDNKQRKQHDKPEVLSDNLLISALRSGLPEMSGVAVGLDRLLMLTLDKKDIAEVLSFPLMNFPVPNLDDKTIH